ncbi:MAG: hypothetical protein NWT08_02470 [Akkermansiaceae bacterium]|jgi:hypothetical protein|nr:hypothetical protein [Akkermansiaceae bacterium]MDP4646268.1 hypothetical protein [Akkermansiaceae bacterium]MDP4779891.1 hypothetical protein [Akkermansiaceae bacterium]MDP4845858.1 hypothetical protein [Akkermansiaceae bacterium]MDP4896269.1 hypothetical protein [Akkermansiaceae bacterium]
MKVNFVAIALVVFSLVNIIILTSLTGVFKPTSAVRFTLTCILSFFLFKGANWARLLVGILSALGAIIGAIGLIGLISAGSPLFSLLSLWLVAMPVFFAWVSYVLLLDKDVAQHFNPKSGF